METVFCCLLLYVALLYFVLIGKAWLRQHRSRGKRPMGLKGFKRLQQCSPAVLKRMQLQSLRVHFVTSLCISSLQWAFCYFHVWHAGNLFAWCWCLHAVCSKACHYHAPTQTQCYCESLFVYMGMRSGHAGNFQCAVVFALCAPIFMPSTDSSVSSEIPSVISRQSADHCNFCVQLNEFNLPSSLQCQLLQKRKGCHACDRKGCWHENPRCLFFRRSRDAHQDATMGNNVPHCRGELNIRMMANEVAVTRGAKPLQANWWMSKNVVIEINCDAYRMGNASGIGCNCLIDTLRQCLHVHCDVAFIRKRLQEKHRSLRKGQMNFGPLKYISSAFCFLSLV